MKIKLFAILLVASQIFWIMPHVTDASEVVQYPEWNATYEQYETYSTQIVEKNISSMKNGIIEDVSYVKFLYPNRSKIFELKYNESHTLFYLALEKIIGQFSGLLGVYEGIGFTGDDMGYLSFTFGRSELTDNEIIVKLYEIANAAREYSSTAYGQLEYINKYLIDNVSYYGNIWNSPEPDMGQSTRQAIMNGTAACGGYAQTVNDLCLLLGIPNVMLSGFGHAWNFVYVDGEWKMLDVTWNDTDGQPKKYFLVETISGKLHDSETYDDQEIISRAQALALALHGYQSGVLPQLPNMLTAKPAASAVLVNGENVAFDAYNIEGNNYFKLRDLAYTLSNTTKHFAIDWDSAANTIYLYSGQPYQAVGGEMAAQAADDKVAVPTSSRLSINSNVVQCTAYIIDGNNYFKLRDVGVFLDFGVEWDGTKNTIVIDTSKGYNPETSPPLETTTPAP